MCDKMYKNKNWKRESRVKMGKAERNGVNKELGKGLFRENKQREIVRKLKNRKGEKQERENIDRGEEGLTVDRGG